MPSSPLTDPDVRISRIRFFTGQVRSRTPAEGVNDPWRRQDQPLEHRLELGPRQPSQAVAAFEPLVPGATNLVGNVSDAPGVAEDAIVGIVAPQEPTPIWVLLTQQVMARPAAVLGHVTQGASQSLLGGLALHDPAPTLRTRWVVSLYREGVEPSGHR